MNAGKEEEEKKKRKRRKRWSIMRQLPGRVELDNTGKDERWHPTEGKNGDQSPTHLVWFNFLHNLVGAPFMIPEENWIPNSPTALDSRKSYGKWHRDIRQWLQKLQKNKMMLVTVDTMSNYHERIALWDNRENAKSWVNRWMTGKSALSVSHLKSPIFAHAKPFHAKITKVNCIPEFYELIGLKKV